MTFRIENRNVGPGYPPFVIAELSANHNGSLGRALRTIEMAKKAGAGAVKLQTYTADTMTIDSKRPDFLITQGPWKGRTLYELYRWAQTPFEWHQEIFEYARGIGMPVFSTPFDESAVDLLEELNTPAYKVASFEATDLPLIRYIAATRKPMIISTGMANEREIREAVDAARSGGCEDLLLMHCVSGYPTPVDQANLATIPDMERRFGCPIGLSDHTLGTLVASAAVALGVNVIEKHVTLSRKDKGPDSEFSLEPDELERLCCDAHSVWMAMGQVGYERKPIEEDSLIFRRSVYFVADVRAGERITAKHIRRIRPGFGLPPKDYDAILGKTASKDIPRGTPASWELVE